MESAIETNVETLEPTFHICRSADLFCIQSSFRNERGIYRCKVCGDVHEISYTQTRRVLRIWCNGVVTFDANDGTRKRF